MIVPLTQVQKDYLEKHKMKRLTFYHESSDLYLHHRWGALFKTKKHQKRTKLLVKIQNHISRMILREYDNTVFSKWNIEIIGSRSVCDLTAKRGQKYILTLHKQGEI